MNASPGEILYVVSAGDTAEVDIDISWDAGASTTRGLLHRLSLSGDELTFEFFPMWHGAIGPIRHELQRAG